MKSFLKKRLYQRIKMKILGPSTDIGRTFSAFLSKLKNIFQPKLRAVQNNKTLYIIYDLRAAPISFNIFEFLLSASIQLGIRKLTSAHLVLLAFENEIENFADVRYRNYSPDYARFKVKNVLVESAFLHEAISGVTLVQTQEQAEQFFLVERELYPRNYDHKVNFALPNLIEDLYRCPEEYKALIRPLSPSKTTQTIVRDYYRDLGIGERALVVLIIRMQNFDKPRNSSIQEWIKFYRYLENEGYFPVIIPDIDNLAAFFPEEKNLRVEPIASFSLDFRLATYEHAWAVLGPDSGLTAFAMFSKSTRVIMMNALAKGSEIATEASYEKLFGKDYKNHNQPWFYNPDRHITSFMEDRFENIKVEFSRIR